jgi:hypothetical protein
VKKLSVSDNIALSLGSASRPKHLPIRRHARPEPQFHDPLDDRVIFDIAEHAGGKRSYIRRSPSDRRGDARGGPLIIRHGSAFGSRSRFPDGARDKTDGVRSISA